MEQIQGKSYPRNGEPLTRVYADVGSTWNDRLMLIYEEASWATRDGTKGDHRSLLERLIDNGTIDRAGDFFVERVYGDRSGHLAKYHVSEIDRPRLVVDR